MAGPTPLGDSSSAASAAYPPGYVPPAASRDAGGAWSEAAPLPAVDPAVDPAAGATDRDKPIDKEALRDHQWTRIGKALGVVALVAVVAIVILGSLAAPPLGLISMTTFLSVGSVLGGVAVAGSLGYLGTKNQDEILAGMTRVRNLWKTRIEGEIPLSYEKDGKKIDTTLPRETYNKILDHVASGIPPTDKNHNERVADAFRHLVDVAGSNKAAVNLAKTLMANGIRATSIKLEDKTVVIKHPKDIHSSVNSYVELAALKKGPQALVNEKILITSFGISLSKAEIYSGLDAITAQNREEPDSQFLADFNRMTKFRIGGKEVPGGQSGAEANEAGQAELRSFAATHNLPFNALTKLLTQGFASPAQLQLALATESRTYDNVAEFTYYPSLRMENDRLVLEVFSRAPVVGVTEHTESNKLTAHWVRTTYIFDPTQMRAPLDEKDPQRGLSEAQSITLEVFPAQDRRIVSGGQLIVGNMYDKDKDLVAQFDSDRVAAI